MDIARQIHVYYAGPRFSRPETNYPITIGGILPHNNRINGIHAQETRTRGATLCDYWREPFEIVSEDSSAALEESNLAAQGGIEQVEAASSSMCIIQ